MIPAKHLQAIIGTSVVSAVAIIAAGVWFFPSRTPTLADYLPADTVIAYAHGITAESRATLEVLYPELGSVIIGDSPTDAALVQNGETPTWIIPSNDQDSETIRRFQTSTGTKLSELPSFRSFKKTMIAGDAWMFVQPQDALANSATFAPFTAPQSAWFAETTSGGLLRLSFTENDAFASIDHLAGLPQHIEDTTVLTASNGAALLTAMQSVLLPTVSPGIASLLSAEIQAQLPQDISPAYDVLPLLTEDSSIRLSASGGLLIRGVAPAGKVQTLLDRAHASFVQQSFSPVIHRETFDDGNFSMDFVDIIDAEESSDETQVLGWTVREATGPSGALFTAHQGGQFIIATDRELFETAVQNGHMVVPAEFSLPLAMLTLSSKAPSSILDQLMPAFLKNMENLKIRTISAHRIGNTLSITFAP